MRMSRKTFIVSLCVLLPAVVVADAQQLKSITGTIVKPIYENHWSGFLLKSGKTHYIVQTDQWPGAAGQAAGEKSYTARRSGIDIDRARTAKVFYSKMDCKWNYTDKVRECYIVAKKVVGID